MDKHLIVHNDVEKYETALKHINNFDLSERNKQLVLEFSTWLRREGISFKRITKYIYHLKFIGKWLEKDI